ncbi:hypothetical protein MMC17_003164 [Xylographa soralifera]|nr:hypothetical protein [Xylographa soralifera]
MADRQVEEYPKDSRTCPPKSCPSRYISIVGDRRHQTNSDDYLASDPALGLSAAPITSTSALEATPVIESVTWPATTTVQAVQEQFPQLVITKAVHRHVEFAEQAILELGESRRVSVFGYKSQIDPLCPSSPTAAKPHPSGAEPPDTPAPTAIPVEKKVYEYNRCSDCERSNPNYEGCNHPEDLPNTLLSPFRQTPPSYNPFGQRLNFLRNPQLKLNMLRTGALSALFTDNLDDAVKGIFVSTLGGNIIAKDAVTSNPKVKRACALGALTWRVNRSLALGDDPTQTARMQSLKTMNTEVTSTNRLKSMIVDLEGEMVAIEYVKEGLLVGVIGEKINKKVETNVDDTGKIGTGKADTERGDEAGEADGAGDAGKADSNGDADVAGKATSTKSLQSQGDINESGGDTNEEGKPEWQDIKNKAEATAEYLRDELHSFKMPAGLEGLE